MAQFNTYPALQMPDIVQGVVDSSRQNRLAQQEMKMRKQEMQMRREKFEWEKHAAMDSQQREKAAQTYGFVTNAAPHLLKAPPVERAAMLPQLRAQAQQLGIDLGKVTDQQLMDDNYLKMAFAQSKLGQKALEGTKPTAKMKEYQLWLDQGNKGSLVDFERAMSEASRKPDKSLDRIEDEERIKAKIRAEYGDAEGTALMQNVEAAGYKPGTPEYQKQMRALLNRDKGGKPSTVTFDVMERGTNKVVTQLRGDSPELDKYMADPKYHVRRTPTVQASSIADLNPSAPGGKRGRERAQEGLSQAPYNLTQITALQREYRNAPGAAGLRGAAGRLAGGLAGQFDPELGEFASEAIADVSPTQLASMQTQALSLIGQNIENITGDDSGRYSDRDLELAKHALATVKVASSAEQIQGALNAVAMMEYVAQERDLIRLGHVPVKLTEERVEKIGNTLKSVYGMDDKIIREIIRRIYTLHKGHEDITGG